MVETDVGVGQRVVGRGREGTVAGEDLSNQMMAALKKRVDPDGLRNLIWRPQGSTRLEIQLPLSSSSNDAEAKRGALLSAREKLEDTNVRAADVLVLPSYSEGVPNVLLEAFACGTRFVASRVGGIPEVAHLGTGWLVPPGDPDALAKGIRKSLEVESTRFAADRPQMRGHTEAAQELAAVLDQARERYRRKVKSRLVLR